MVEAIVAPIVFVVFVAVLGIAVVIVRIRRRASSSVPRSASEVAPHDAETERRRKTG